MAKTKRFEKPKLAKTTLRYFFSTTWHASKSKTLAEIILIPFNTLVANILIPTAIAALIGKLSTGSTDLSFYAPTLIFLFASYIVDIISYRIIDWLDWGLDADQDRYIRQICFKKLSNETVYFHIHNFAGTLTSRVGKFINACMNFRANIIWSIYPLLISTILTAITIWSASPIFAAIVLIFLFCFIGFSYLAYLKTFNIEMEIPEAQTEATGRLSDVITNIINVKSFAGEKYENKRYNQSVARIHRAIERSRKIHLKRNSILSLIVYLARIAMIATLVCYHQQLGLTVTSIVLVFNLTWNITSSAWSICNVFRRIAKCFNDANGMVEILEQPIKIVDNTDKELVVKRADISLRNIAFKHSDQKELLFEDFSLDIKDGERIGLVGLSGSGKTTLTKLILRFEEACSGHILIDGQDVTQVTQESLHKNIAYVPQEPILFHRSIAENIAYGKPDATREEIIHAAKLAGADEFIVKLDEGYDTEIGERGATLSGGQRQRVAIARAILKDAPILVLDEATSALDSESEAIIQKSMAKLLAGRTSIVIAHRLSTIADLDRIIVLKDGKIVEDGSHRQLLLRNGPYKKLWARQSGAFLETNDEEDQSPKENN